MNDSSTSFRTTSILLCALVGAAGCGVELPADDASASTQALKHSTADPWSRTWVHPSAAKFTDSPGVCGVKQGVVLVGRDATSNKFRTLPWQNKIYAGTVATSPEWADYGANTFNSKPACTSLDEVETANNIPNTDQVAIVGRGTDNKFYIRTAKVDTGLPGTLGSVAQPTEKVAWSKITDTTYTSGPSVTVANGKVMVVGRRSDDRIYIKENPLKKTAQGALDTTNPYDNGGWGVAVKAPALPSGWTPQGDPVVVNTVPAVALVTVFTRAKNASNTNKIFWCVWNGTNFTSTVPGDTWQQIPTDVTVAGDPAAEFDTTLGAGVTLYYRSTDNVFYQASGIVHGWGDPFKPVHTAEGDVFAGNGAVVGNGDFEGRHMLVARKSSNELWWNACTPGVY